jgi:hypothetical protein
MLNAMKRVLPGALLALLVALAPAGQKAAEPPPFVERSGPSNGCGSQCRHPQALPYVGQADNAPQDAVVGKWQASCGLGIGHPPVWYGPVRDTYEEAKNDAAFHNLGGGHGATVCFFPNGRP